MSLYRFATARSSSRPSRILLDVQMEKMLFFFHAEKREKKTGAEGAGAAPEAPEA
jgi:hypothetical protein